jgi:hypothetical protein
MNKVRVEERFGRLVVHILQKHGNGKPLMSDRVADLRAKVSSLLIKNMREGKIPSHPVYIRSFADQLKELRTELLGLFG